MAQSHAKELGAALKRGQQLKFPCEVTKFILELFCSWMFRALQYIMTSSCPLPLHQQKKMEENVMENVVHITPNSIV